MAEELRRRMAELPFRELYEVGGSLRDELLGREPKDVDFLVRGHDVGPLFCRAVNGQGCARLRGLHSLGATLARRGGGRSGGSSLRGAPIAGGFTGPHTDFRIEPDPELPVRDDLERRDFTVNAGAGRA